MFKVKYYDTIAPQSFELTFETETEAAEWISTEMDDWYEILCDMYPNGDVTWLNRLLDCGDTTEIYIPDTSVIVCCELIKETTI